MSKQSIMTMVFFLFAVLHFSTMVDAKNPHHDRVPRFRYQRAGSPLAFVSARPKNSHQILPGSKISLPVRGVSAHRGESFVFPENTLPAFREAARLGAHQIEFDVAVTKDGKYVILHDTTVDRTTNGTGKISEMTFDEVRRLDAGIKKGERFRGTLVPTLDEALDCMPRNIWLNVHLKNEADSAFVASKIREKNRLHQAFLACTLEQALAARKVCPEIMICNMSRSPAKEYVDKTISNKCSFIQIIKNKYKQSDIAKLHQAGIRVNCFGIGVNEPTELLKTMLDDGIDFPLVDRLDDMLREAEKHGIPRWTPVWDAK